MKVIRLHRTNFIAFVSNEDYDRVKQYTWSAFKHGRTVYARRRTPGQMYMHRFILDAQQGQECDHIDGNGLNNTRENIRIVSHSENQLNSAKHREGVIIPHIQKPYAGAYIVKFNRKNLKFTRTFRSLTRAIECRDAILRRLKP